MNFCHIAKKWLKFNMKRVKNVFNFILTIKKLKTKKNKNVERFRHSVSSNVFVFQDIDFIFVFACRQKI